MSVLGGNVLDASELAKSGVADAPLQGTSREAKSGEGHISAAVDSSSTNSTHKGEVYEDTPNDEDLKSLRRVSGKIPWAAWTIAFCELCERFSYYGKELIIRGQKSS